MRIAEIIQTVIHKWDVGTGQRYLRILILASAILLQGICYNSCAYKNISAPEGMDAAQLARNLATGQGYTTQLVRPFSLYLVQDHNQSRDIITGTNAPDFARIRTAHPDLANAPLYPVMLAGLMKILPFNYNIELRKAFWSENGRFWRYQPDFFIAMLNELLLLAAVILTFFIARKMFDERVAWLSAIMVIGCNLLWRFSVSGTSTMLVLVIFLGLAWCIQKIEELAREPDPRMNVLFAISVAAGALTGLGALTRYSIGWVIIPVTLFLVFFSGSRRVLHVLGALGAFGIILAPWIVRNFVVSGTPFGTAGYAIVENTFLFPHYQLERSIHPDLTHVTLTSPYVHKLVENVRTILNDQLPRLGGSWASVFFLAGLLLEFRSLAVRRMRYFLVMCMVMFIVVQSLGQTELSIETPEINSENLLVLLAPLVFIYGVSLFFTLLDQMRLPLFELRYAVIAGFAALSCLQMIFALLPPRGNPIAYPPYYPPEIQQTAGWLAKDELEMSDVPWAVAWYGNRQCVWVTLNAENDFFYVNDNYKRIRALYLTPETMDGKLLSDWILPHEYSWGSFIIGALTQGEIPPKFPLRYAPPQVKFLPERLFLADSALWKLRPNTVE
ncbi:MAG TPA: glycosyltransferase family 39 protein [Desulfuromonadaceae bacterium]|nr:glycosyltransferase family 39 protein [Desulfuromonadaceae bacterium]